MFQSNQPSSNRPSSNRPPSADFDDRRLPAGQPHMSPAGQPQMSPPHWTSSEEAAQKMLALANKSSHFIKMNKVHNQPY